MKATTKFDVRVAIGHATECASAALKYAKAEEDKAAALHLANEQVKALRKMKVEVGNRKSGDQLAIAFFDSMVAGGKTAQSAANYLCTFRHAVKTGETITDWNKSRAAKDDLKEGEVEGGAGKSKQEASLADHLVKCYNHKDWSKFLRRIEKQYVEDAHGNGKHRTTIQDCIRDYMMECGCSFADDKKSKSSKAE